MPPRTDLDWMTLQVETWYEHDDLGRLLGSRWMRGGDCDLVFWGRTRLGNIWRLHRDLPDEVVREVARLMAAERTGVELERPPERLAAVRDRLEAVRPVEVVWSGPAFRFPPVLPAAPDARALRADELPRAAAAFPGLASALPERAPWRVVECQGELASVCCCATPLGAARGAVEAGVETAPGWRGLGLATQATAAWARAVRDRGVEPLYSTAWEDAAARGVARRLGLLRYGADLSLR